MNFAWRKWKLGLAVSVILALLVAGSGLAAGMHWQALSRFTLHGPAHSPGRLLKEPSG